MPEFRAGLWLSLTRAPSPSRSRALSGAWGCVPPASPHLVKMLLDCAASQTACQGLGGVWHHHVAWVSVPTRDLVQGQAAAGGTGRAGRPQLEGIALPDRRLRRPLSSLEGPVYTPLAGEGRVHKRALLTPTMSEAGRTPLFPRKSLPPTQRGFLCYEQGGGGRAERGVEAQSEVGGGVPGQDQTGGCAKLRQAKTEGRMLGSAPLIYQTPLGKRPLSSTRPLWQRCCGGRTGGSCVSLGPGSWDWALGTGRSPGGPPPHGGSLLAVSWRQQAWGFMRPQGQSDSSLAQPPFCSQGCSPLRSSTPSPPPLVPTVL